MIFFSFSIYYSATYCCLKSEYNQLQYHDTVMLNVLCVIAMCQLNVLCVTFMTLRLFTWFKMASQNDGM